MTKTMTKTLAPVALKTTVASRGFNSSWFLNQPKMPNKLIPQKGN